MASSSWCGMEAGSDMVYPAQASMPPEAELMRKRRLSICPYILFRVHTAQTTDSDNVDGLIDYDVSYFCIPGAEQCVDGLVDRAGGASLRSELRRVAMRELQLKSAADKDKDAALEDEEVLCPVGHAVASAPPLGSSLRESFSVVVHTATPTWPPGCPSGAAQWRKDALSCYGASLRAASAATQGEHKGNGGCVVVSPLICAGTRGAPQEEAAKVAAEAAAEWLFSSSASSGTEAAAVDDGGIRGLWFAVQSEETAAEVLRCFKESPLGMPCREEACDDAGEEGIDSVE